MPRSISPAWRRSAMREGTSRTREKRGSASNPCTSGTAFRYETTPKRNGTTNDLNAETAEDAQRTQRTNESCPSAASANLCGLCAERATRLPFADLVEHGVALDGAAAGLADQPDQLVDGEDLRRFRPRVVGDLLLGHGAVDVVGPEREADLGQARADHDPVRLHVGEVVEHQPADRDRLQVLERGRLRAVHRRRLPRLE